MLRKWLIILNEQQRRVGMSRQVVYVPDSIEILDEYDEKRARLHGAHPQTLPDTTYSYKTPLHTEELVLETGVLQNYWTGEQWRPVTSEHDTKHTGEVDYQ